MSMIGDSGHGKCCIGKSIENGMKYRPDSKYGYSHKAYALIGDLDSLQIGNVSGGESTY